MHTSGKIIAAALFGVALIGFALWNKMTSSSNAIALGDTRVTTVPVQDTDVVDTDQDGLKDWEEVLLGTDINNPDSNNNGIGDKEELEAARQALSNTVIGTTTTEGLTKTDQLTRDVFGTYIQSKQLGIYSPADFEGLIAQVTNSQFISDEPQYALEDIATDSDTSAERTREYERAFQDAIWPVNEIEEYELTTYGRGVQTGNEEEFEKLQRASEIYTGIAKTLIEIVVPVDAAQVHLDLVNSFDLFGRTLSTMAESPDDPLLALVSTRSFLTHEDGIKTAYVQMNIYFTLKDESIESLL